MLLLATSWAVLHYGSDGDVVLWVYAGTLAVVVVALPKTLAYAKLAAHNGRQWWESRGGYSFERGTIYRSAEVVTKRIRLIDDVAACLEDEANYEDARHDEFPEGPGLTVTHAGFHNIFLRITQEGRVVVTGASERTRDFAHLLRDRFGLTMERTRVNPLLEPWPVRGAPRVFLGLFLVALVLVGVVTIGAAAYQTTAYNPAEKVVLVGFDAHSDLPNVDDDEARLRKASFVVGVVEEEAVEIRWERNSSGRIETHARQSLHASAHADHLLNVTLRGGDRGERADAMDLRASLERAERNVSQAIETRNTGNISSRGLSRMQEVLANRSVDDTSGRSRYG